MLAPMMLLLALVSPTPVLDVQGAPDHQQPPIQVSLNNDGRYAFGDAIRVHVRPAEDGYLVVLRTDVHGWVRVLYPANPPAENFVRGGVDIEIRGPQGGEAFEAGPSAGTGTIVAARAHEAFHFDRFVVANHWNYRALDSARAGADPERALVGIVQQMAGDVHFDYDVVQYSVADSEAAAGSATDYAADDGGPAYGYGYPYYPYYPYSPYPYYWPYDPFFGFFGVTFYSPFLFSPYCYGCFGGYAFGGRGIGFGRPFAPFGPYRPRASYGTGLRARAPVAAPASRVAVGRNYIARTGSRAAMSYRAAPRSSGGARMSYGAAPRSSGGARMSSGAPRGGGGGYSGRSGGGGGGRRGR